MAEQCDAVVVGAGVAGLAAAVRLTSLGATVAVIESAPRAGGKVAQVDVGGRAIDVGPESFITRAPDARAFCAELGLADELVAPAPLGAQLWIGGRLRPLPRGMAPGVPTSVKGLAASGAVSSRAVARAALERWLPPGAPAGDLSVGALLRGRFGNEAFEKVIDPLVSGIHAGDADRLSAEAIVPHLVDALRRGRALSTLASPAPGGPAFLTLRGGLQTLVDAATAALAHGALRTGSVVDGVEAEGRNYIVRLGSGAELEAPALVLATPPAVTGRLLGRVSPVAAELVAEIPSVAVATVTMSFAPSALELPATTGFLVPRRERRLMVGCTFLSRKWPHLAHDGTSLVRCAVGRDGDTEWQAMDDATLAEAVRREFELATGARARPQAFAVRRFPDGIPQYRVGHRARVDKIEGALAERPGLALAGAAYRGVGLPACIASGRRAAEIALAASSEAAA